MIVVGVGGEIEGRMFGRSPFFYRSPVDSPWVEGPSCVGHMKPKKLKKKLTPPFLPSILHPCRPNPRSIISSLDSLSPRSALAVTARKAVAGIGFPGQLGLASHMSNKVMPTTNLPSWASCYLGFITSESGSCYYGFTIAEIRSGHYSECRRLYY